MRTMEIDRSDGMGRREPSRPDAPAEEWWEDALLSACMTLLATPAGLIDSICVTRRQYAAPEEVKGIVKRGEDLATCHALLCDVRVGETGVTVQFKRRGPELRQTGRVAESEVRGER